MSENQNGIFGLCLNLFSNNLIPAIVEALHKNGYPNVTCDQIIAELNLPEATKPATKKTTVKRVGVASDAKKCSKTLATGKQCSKNATKGNDMCSMHQNQKTGDTKTRVRKPVEQKKPEEKLENPITSIAEKKEVHVIPIENGMFLHEETGFILNSDSVVVKIRVGSTDVDINAKDAERATEYGLRHVSVSKSVLTPMIKISEQKQPDPEPEPEPKDEYEQAMMEMEEESTFVDSEQSHEPEQYSVQQEIQRPKGPTVIVNPMVMNVKPKISRIDPSMIHQSEEKTMLENKTDDQHEETSTQFPSKITNFPSKPGFTIKGPTKMIGGGKPMSSINQLKPPLSKMTPITNKTTLSNLLANKVQKLPSIQPITGETENQTATK